MHMISVAVFLCSKIPFPMETPLTRYFHFFDAPYYAAKFLYWPWEHPSFLHALYTLSMYYTDAPICNGFFSDKFSFLSYFVLFQFLVYMVSRLARQLLHHKNAIILGDPPPSGGSCIFLSMKIINAFLSVQPLAFDLHTYSYLLISVLFSHLATEFVLIGSFKQIDLLSRFSSVVVSVFLCRYIYSPILW